MFGRKCLGKNELHFFIKCMNALGNFKVMHCLPVDGFKEELAPLVPISGLRNLAHQFCVVFFVFFKISADIKMWCTDQSARCRLEMGEVLQIQDGIQRFSPKSGLNRH